MKNHDVITKLGGIGKARELLSGAPSTATHYFAPRYFEEWISGKWTTLINNQWHDCKKPTGSLINLDDLRTAIDEFEFSGRDDLEILEMIDVSPNCGVIYERD
ncbi:hypothetical protein EC844_12560 [Acinetobacter calcoaceticus]|uniref:Uncharacterized protein n=1 Tax=Acinetobacter calcoaceticus TaxID=471 RepID=A0A4R1XHQ4_ACICA|nr:hypothetical protein EC844_12560 [Acinetobacter calcoaceticus]